MTTEFRESNDALSWVGSISSIVGVVAVLTLQQFELNNLTLVFWWVTTAIIALASLAACFSVPSFGLRAIFAVVFVLQLAAFNWSWAELYDKQFSIEALTGDQVNDEQFQKMLQTKHENTKLKIQMADSLLFWKSVSHLVGIGFALLACTAAGQKRIQILYDT